MTSVQPTMLWESTDVQVALTQRFQFASAEHASNWLINTVSSVYHIPVESVDRLLHLSNRWVNVYGLGRFDDQYLL